MAKTNEHNSTNPISDIAEQAYQGTNELVSSLGYGALETKAGLLIGVPLGGAIGAIMPEKVDKAGESLQKSIHNNVEKLKGHHGAKGFFAVPARWGLQASNWVLGVADKTSHHVFETIPPKTSKRMQNFIGGGKADIGAARFKGAVKGGALGAAAGFVIASFTGTAHGAIVAHDGRKQFNTAKDEIRKLRQENAELKGRHEAVHALHKETSHQPEVADIAGVPSSKIDAATAETDKRRDDKQLAELAR